jgi:hypothetical protein
MSVYLKVVGMYLSNSGEVEIKNGVMVMGNLCEICGYRMNLNG